MEQSSISKNDSSTSTPSQKKLILMCGLPGAGKTTTAHRIRQALGDAIIVRRDRYIRNRYKRNDRLHEYDEYAKKQTTITDGTFYADVDELFAIYTTIIFDGTFKQNMKRQAAFDFGQKHGCQLFMIECICSDHTLIQRMKRQMLLGHKKFITSLEDILIYYKKSMQAPKEHLRGVNFIQLDTENNQIVLKSFQDDSSKFGEQLIEILKRPFKLSLFEPFCAISYYEDGWIEEISNLPHTKVEKHGLSRTNSVDRDER